MPASSSTGTARERLLAAALELFAEHGVSGTSLQMIADRLGVTKAAVYHQFPSKDEIVLAVIEPALARLAPIAEAAERLATPAARRQRTLRGIIDLVVEHRRLSAVLSYDPVVMRLVRGHAAVATLIRIRALLTGPDPDVAAWVNVAMVSGGLISVGADPAMTDVPDDELHRQLLTTACRAMGVRVPRAG
jgi:AcrR family transcriptional regulator